MIRALIIVQLWCCLAAAQPASQTSWSDWKSFLGKWRAAGGGSPGEGIGEFSFDTELQGKVLIRHSYASYPKSKNGQAVRHDDLMVIYVDPSTKKPRAYYWDSEGHFIVYEIELSPEKLIFTSDDTQPGPRYRLKYLRTGEDTLTLSFEIAPPNDRTNFKKYIEGSARRISQAR